MMETKKMEKEVKTPTMVRGSKYNQTPVWLAQHDHNQQGRYTANINTPLPGRRYD